MDFVCDLVYVVLRAIQSLWIVIKVFSWYLLVRVCLCGFSSSFSSSSFFLFRIV